jgi:hypothetical protein
MFHKGILQQNIEPKEVVLAKIIPIREILVVEEMKTPQNEALVKIALPLLHLRGKEK